MYKFDNQNKLFISGETLCVIELPKLVDYQSRCVDIEVADS